MGIGRKRRCAQPYGSVCRDAFSSMVLLCHQLDASNVIVAKTDLHTKATVELCSSSPQSNQFFQLRDWLWLWTKTHMQELHPFVPFIRYRHSVLAYTAGSALGYFRQINVSLLAFHTYSHEYSHQVWTSGRSGPCSEDTHGATEEPIKVLAWGSLVITMQGIFFITIRWGEAAWHEPQVSSALPLSRSL